MTAIVGILILIPFLVFSNDWPLILMTSVIGVLAVFEILRCTGLVKQIHLTVISLATVLFAQIATRILTVDRYLTVALIVYMVYAVISMTFSVFSKGKIQLSDLCQSAMIIVYVSFGLSCLTLLRDFSEEYGLVLFLLAFFVPWVCDAMAYFVGVFFGKHKMIPDVSPKKTVEGAVGGIVGVVLAIVIFGLVMHFGFGKQPNYFLLIALALIGGLVSQWGDLIASLLKREYGIKDYGKVFPGHGGVMDRFDSLFSVSIFIFAACKLFEQVTLFVSW